MVNLRLLKVDLPEIQGKSVFIYHFGLCIRSVVFLTQNTTTTTEVNTEAIAKEKALLGAQLAGGPCVVEDTSLAFEALGTLS